MLAIFVIVLMIVASTCLGIEAFLRRSLLALGLCIWAVAVTISLLGAYA